MATKKTALPKTWEAFCKQTGRNPKLLPTIKGGTKKEVNRAIAGFILPLVIAHCNEGPLDYTDTSQWKYYPRWVVKANKKNPSGFGLSYHDYDIWNTDANCGPAFSFFSVKALLHVTKYFKKYYEHLYL